MGRCSRDKRDAYYRIAKGAGFRSRAAFKLLQLDQRLHILDGATKVVDLCSAPGGWSQVVAARLGREATIVAVDLKAVAPIDGVVRIVGDITSDETLSEVEAALEGAGPRRGADLVLCDGAPDVTGRVQVDGYLQHQLVVSAMESALRLLSPQGVFLSKIYRGRGIGELVATLQGAFEDVLIAKPRTSRNASVEAFVVCRRRRATRLALPLSPIPFVAAGELDDFDSDASYPLQLIDDDSYDFRQPVQMPLNPTHLAAQLAALPRMEEEELPDYTPVTLPVDTRIPEAYARGVPSERLRFFEHAPPATDAESLAAWLTGEPQNSTS